MRLRPVPALAALAVLAAGCGRSDAQLEADLRDQLIDGCGRQVAPAVAPNLDPQRFCNCFADRSIGDRSVADLKSLSDEQRTAAGQEAATACSAELSGRAARPAPPPAPASVAAERPQSEAPADDFEPQSAEPEPEAELEEF